LKHGRGGNSILLELRNAQDEEEPIKILKLCKFYVSTSGRIKKIHSRFLREIEALEKCKANNTQNVIEIFNKGKIEIGSKTFLCYIMESAQLDLTSFLANNNIDDRSRLEFCIEIASALNDLHNIGIYHRDIKPDNILKVNEEWKIGDLGLCDMRDQDIELDDIGDFIGPRGWVSPETMNKYLTESVTHYTYDCHIDKQSDIFQLGKLLWYILQGNVPIGGIKNKDFRFAKGNIFPLLKSMINYSKEHRPKDINFVISELQRVYNRSFR
jgi:serine/threonine protein kinase